MSMPFDGVESEVVKQGLTFLFGQATEILKRRRAAKGKAVDTTDATPPNSGVVLPPLEPPEGVFAPDSAPKGRTAPELLDTLTDELVLARHELEDYVNASSALNPRSVETLAAIARLRRVIGEIYGADLRFAGEQPMPPASKSSQVTIDQRNFGVVAGRNIKAKKIIGSQPPIRD